MNTKRGGFSSIFLVLMLVFVPVVGADPEVVPVSEAAVFVAAGDYIEFAPASIISAGTTIEITAPDGATVQLTRNANDIDDSDPIRYDLGADEFTAEPENPGWLRTSATTLNGAASDGTWTVQISGYYQSEDTPVFFFVPDSEPGVTLVVQGKAIRFGVSPDAPTTLTQLWNWHQTTGTWEEPSTTPSAPEPPNSDPTDEGPEEDPEFSRYYSQEAPPPPDCSDAAGTMYREPTGNTTAEDNDGDGFNGRYGTEYQNYTLNADCSSSPDGDPYFEYEPGEDPDDNDPDNPDTGGGDCTTAAGTMYREPTGNTTAEDNDGDGFNGRYGTEYQNYTLNADCSSSPDGDPYFEYEPGEDPDDNDPNNPNLSGDPYPKAFTADSTVTCPDTLEIRGVWARGLDQTTNTTGYFYYADGFQTDENLLTSQTNETDLGSGLNGTHNATIEYNNLIGNTYQFVVTNGTGPEQRGQLQYVVQQQCNQELPDTSGFTYDPDAFNIRVSQGQCSIDNTTISLNSANDITGTETLDVFLIDAETGMVLRTYNKTDYFNSPTNRHFFHSTFIPTGDWIILALSDQQGLGTNDHYAREAFNVKEGPCTKPTLDDITVLVNNAFLNATLKELQEHRHNTLEVFGMSFETLGFDGFLYFLFFVIIAALCYWHGWTFNALVATLAFLTMFFPNPPIGSIGFIYLLAVGFMLEYFVGGLAGLRKRFRKDHDGDDGNFMNN